MSPFGDDDLPTYFSDFGEPVTFGTGTFSALVDLASEDLDDGSGIVVVGKTWVLTYSSLDPVASTLRKGSAVTVRGKSFQLSAPPRPFDDGQTSKAFLELA